MALKRYEVEVNGFKTTVQLSDEDAEAQGLKPLADKAKAAPNKSRTPANKARTTADKRQEAAAKAFNKPNKADG